MMFLKTGKKIHPGKKRTKDRCPSLSRGRQSASRAAGLQSLPNKRLAGLAGDIRRGGWNYPLGIFQKQGEGKEGKEQSGRFYLLFLLDSS